MLLKIVRDDEGGRRAKYRVVNGLGANENFQAPEPLAGLAFIQALKHSRSASPNRSVPAKSIDARYTLPYSNTEKAVACTSLHVA